MPKIAVTHIQKIAPGPPSAIAVATPARLPVPTWPESAVESAAKGEISPAPALLRPLNRPAKALPSLTSG